MMNNKLFSLLCLLTMLAFVACSKSESDDINGNSKESTASKEMTFGTMTDQDGNTYKTVTIGSQTWMAENLKAIHYSDGTNITNAQTTRDWGKNYTGAYCSYENNDSNIKSYGLLYNWYAVNTGKLAPKGWHVATDEEWNTLFSYLTANGFGYTTGQDDIAKALASTSGWTQSSKNGAVGNNQSDNNKSGFNAVAGGKRYCEGGFETFNNKTFVCNEGNWWSASSTDGAHYFTIVYDCTFVSNGNIDRRYGYSVRCIKDK